MRSTYALIPAVLALVVSSGHAQKSNTKGFLGNVHYNRTSLKTEGSSKTEKGNGIGVRLGWGFSPNFTGYLGLGASKMIIDDASGGGDYGLGQGDLGVTYNFASAQRALVPYVELALSSQAIAYSVGGSDIKQAGSGFTFGGGINYFFSRSAALQVGLNFTSSKFGDAEVDGTKVPNSGGTGSGGQLMVGFNWYPMKR